jgi:hypothetical protein
MNASAKRIIIVRVFCNVWQLVELGGSASFCYWFCTSGIGPMRWLPTWLSHHVDAGIPPWEWRFLFCVCLFMTISWSLMAIQGRTAYKDCCAKLDRYLMRRFNEESNGDAHCKKVPLVCRPLSALVIGMAVIPASLIAIVSLIVIAFDRTKDFDYPTVDVRPTLSAKVVTLGKGGG